jgi:hypothetical protein
VRPSIETDLLRYCSQRLKHQPGFGFTALRTSLVLVLRILIEEDRIETFCINSEPVEMNNDISFCCDVFEEDPTEAIFTIQFSDKQSEFKTVVVDTRDFIQND